jgi:hypothetical protein
MTEHEEVAAIPLVEERLSIAKRQVEAGRLRVRITVDEREERVPVELAHDEMVIERVPKNLPVAALPECASKAIPRSFRWSRRSWWSRSGWCWSRKYMCGGKPRW